MKLYHGIKEDVNKKNINDDHKMLLHMVLIYFIFGNSMNIFREWIRSNAEEHNMRPEKYAKIIYN